MQQSTGSTCRPAAQRLSTLPWAICFIISRSEIPIQQWPWPGAVGDRSFVGRPSPREERVEPVHGVVEEEVVGLAHPDMQLSPELGAELGQFCSSTRRRS